MLVVGATGRVGREVVAQLCRANQPVRALSRRPEAANLPAGVELVAGDLTDPDSLEPALEKVRVVFLVWTAPFTTSPAVIARVARSVERIVLLSSPYQTAHPFFQQPNPLAARYAGLERLIADTELGATIIRPGIFAANAIGWWASQIRAGGVIRWPYGAVETAPIDERDIAAVAVRTLIDEHHVGRDYVITGPESLSQAEQVRLIGEEIGRALRFHDLTPDEFRGEIAGIWPQQMAEMLLDAWGAAAGIPAYVTSTVAEVTGKAAHTFAEWAGANVDAFQVRSRP